MIMIGAGVCVCVCVCMRACVCVCVSAYISYRPTAQYILSCSATAAAKTCFSTAAFACSAHTESLKTWIESKYEYILYNSIHSRVCKDATLSPLWDKISK